MAGFPIENIKLPITYRGGIHKQFYIRVSAYPTKTDDIQVVAVFSHGKGVKSNLTLLVKGDEDMVKRTNERTVLFAACIETQKRIQKAVNSLCDIVLGGRRTFIPQLIGIRGECLTYNGRGYYGLAVEV